MNKHRHSRSLDKGDVVFRRMPGHARPAKHLLSEPSRGPYHVIGQSTLSSCILKDPATGLLVDGGVDIPLDQIPLGPRRAPLAFEKDEHGSRTIGQMLQGKDQSGELRCRLESRKASKLGNFSHGTVRCVPRG